MTTSSQSQEASSNGMTDLEEKELEKNLAEQSDSILQSLSSKSGKLSVLITGGSQNGKSSMIKAIFGEEIAVDSKGITIATGKDGRPVTQNVSSYVNREGNFELIDTPGLERDVNKPIVKTIQNELKEKQLKPSVVWVVLNYQTSMEDVELNLVDLVPDAPVIIIVNKCDLLQKRIKFIQKDSECIEYFDQLAVNNLPNWMKNNEPLMAKRERLLCWKNSHERVRRIVITSLGSGEPYDENDDIDPEIPIGLDTLIQATWGCLDEVGRILLAQVQKSTKIGKLKGSIAIVLAAAASAAGKRTLCIKFNCIAGNYIEVFLRSDKIFTSNTM